MMDPAHVVTSVTPLPLMATGAHNRRAGEGSMALIVIEYDKKVEGTINRYPAWPAIHTSTLDTPRDARAERFHCVRVEESHY